MIEVSKVNESELKMTSGHGKWDRVGIGNEFTEIAEKYPNSVIGMPIENSDKGLDGKPKGFYDRFRIGGRIKYISYYCKKILQESLTSLSIPADVRTNKNTLLVQFKSQTNDSESKELEESENEEGD